MRAGSAQTLVVAGGDDVPGVDEAPVRPRSRAERRRRPAATGCSAAPRRRCRACRPAPCGRRPAPGRPGTMTIPLTAGRLAVVSRRQVEHAVGRGAGVVVVDDLVADDRAGRSIGQWRRRSVERAGLAGLGSLDGDADGGAAQRHHESDHRRRSAEQGTASAARRPVRHRARDATLNASAAWLIPNRIMRIPKRTASASTVNDGQVSASTPTTTLVAPLMPRRKRSSPSPNSAAATLTSPPATSAIPTVTASGQIVIPGHATATMAQPIHSPPVRRDSHGRGDVSAETSSLTPVSTSPSVINQTSTVSERNGSARSTHADDHTGAAERDHEPPGKPRRQQRPEWHQPLTSALATLAVGRCPAGRRRTRPAGRRWRAARRSPRRSTGRLPPPPEPEPALDRRGRHGRASWCVGPECRGGRSSVGRLGDDEDRVGVGVVGLDGVGAVERDGRRVDERGAGRGAGSRRCRRIRRSGIAPTARSPSVTRHRPPGPDALGRHLERHRRTRTATAGSARRRAAAAGSSLVSTTSLASCGPLFVTTTV